MNLKIIFPQNITQIITEIQVILQEILDKKIIRESIHESTEFVPPIFMFKMPDGGPRLILNLKELNQFVK